MNRRKFFKLIGATAIASPFAVSLLTKKEKSVHYYTQGIEFYVDPHYGHLLFNDRSIVYVNERNYNRLKKHFEEIILYGVRALKRENGLIVKSYMIK